jgi:hypoxanthine phosphoribosyltransferase
MPLEPVSISTHLQEPAPMPRILFPAEVVRDRVAELARTISADYAGRQLDVVCLINGASTFCADLIRHITVPVRQHFIGFTSYPGAPRSGEVRITLDVAEPLLDRHVLIVEGVVVSGRTPRFIVEWLRLRGPASIALCAVATKPKTLAVDLEVKYAAFELGDQMAAGYGIGKGEERASPHLLDLAGE